MKRIFLGILLDVVATIAMLFFVVLPAVMPIDDVPGLEPILQTVLCERGETVEVERSSYSRRPGQVSYSANFYCVREAGTRRDVSGRVMLFGLILFIVPMLVGVLLIISGSISMKKYRKRNDQANVISLLQGFGISVEDHGNNFGGMTPDAGESVSLTERLKALKNAYDQGLITIEEYESKRKEILRDV
jgi:hypothetical protein